MLPSLMHLMKTKFTKRLAFISGAFFMVFSFPLIRTYDKLEGRPLPLSIILFFVLWLIYILVLMRITRKEEDRE